MLIRQGEFIKLLNLSKPGVRRSFIFVELLHLANYQIHRTSEFIEISNSWKPQIHRTLGPVLRVHQSPTNPCEVLAFSKWRTRRNTRRDFFWAIKGNVYNVGTGWKSLSGLWNIDVKCGSNSSRNCFQEGGPQGLIKITKLTYQKFTGRGKRSIDSTPDETARLKFANEVASAIAKGLKWNTVVIDWFAYPNDVKNASDPTSLEMVMVLADKKALGIVTSISPSFNFSQSFQQLSSTIEAVTLPLQVDGYNVWLKSLASCTDKSCNETQTLATSDKPPVWLFRTTLRDGGPVTGDILVTRKPAKRNGGVRIPPRKVAMYGITTALLIVFNKLSF